MALVITLIMLAVVTLMAVTFLALSRRERASVTATADLTAAKLAADTGAARAQAELVARVAVQSNLFAYDLKVSTNLISRAGFDRKDTFSFTNVNYTYADGTRLNRDDLFRNLTNLYYDPRPPVFVVTNASLPLDNPARSEFRFYLDLNRNGRFDTNGLQPIVTAGRWSDTNLANFVGDPEWVGILEHPDQPHSASNLFIGRYAYLMLPAGKSLDLNFIHNSAKNFNLGVPRPVPEGFWRNQGVGSWELNLAAFLQTLLPTFYDVYQPEPSLASSSRSWAFLDALEILRYRYNDTRASLRSVFEQFDLAGANAFERDQIDGYSDGALVLTNRLLENSVGVDLPDDPTRPWPGSDNVQGYYSVQELFDNDKVDLQRALNPDLADRLLIAGNDYVHNPPPGDFLRNSSNVYAFSRLLAQLGTDSLPATRNKLNLNYDNVTPYFNQVASATNFLPWANSLSFFTNAADRLLRQYPGFKRGLADGIQVYPNNFYTPDVHRLLQLAANIGDALTNRVLIATNLPLPSVFRPVFTNSLQGGTNLVAIIGYEEIIGTNALRQPWLEVTNVPTGQVVRGVNVYGVPWVVGTKKGLPNFNEFHLESLAQVSRRLQAVKANATDRNPRYYQSWALTITNYLGAEVWNSYTQAFPVPLTLWMTNRCAIGLRDANSNVVPPAASVIRFTNFFVSANVATNLAGNRFLLPLDQQVRFVPESTYLPTAIPPLRSLTNVNTIQFDATLGYPVPEWKLELTNRLQLALIAQGRIIDFVNLDNLRASLDVANVLAATNQSGGRLPPPGTAGRAGAVTPQSFWRTDRLGGLPTAMTFGIAAQIQVSTNDVLSDADWRDFSPNPVSGQQKRDAIDGFRVFLGMDPLFDAGYRIRHPELATRRTMQVPYSPSVKMDQALRWQANDPLVHYHIEDLFDIRLTSTNTSDVTVLGAQQRGTNASNLGMVNKRYSPWGGPPLAGGPEDPFAFNPAVKDPMIAKSDDWDFPTNKFPSLGWLGRVHRGTPWQTIYLKSGVEDPRQWMLYAGGLNPRRSLLTHPTNDWRLLELFTVAPNDNAARGLLSVNQTNEAAWAAVLCGVSVLTNHQGTAVDGKVPAYGYLYIEPNTPQFSNIVYNINTNRAARGGTFRHLGEVLSSPALTVASPYLNTNVDQSRYGITDAVYERIPQQILSLLKEDEPYVVVYAYGQSLKPADRSRVTAPGTYFNLCTNYQITGEVLTKTAVRLEEFQRPNDTNTYYRGIVESYNLLPTD